MTVVDRLSEEEIQEFERKAKKMNKFEAKRALY